MAKRARWVTMTAYVEHSKRPTAGRRGVMRRIVFAVAAIVVVIVLLAANAANNPRRGTATPGSTTPPVAATGAYSPDVLANASAMTQRMSGNGPVTGHEYHGHEDDQQLELSRVPAFTRALESYQQQMDRMLGLAP
jgi:hypothetical protein